MTETTSLPNPSLYDDPNELADAVDTFFADPSSRASPYAMFSALHRQAPVYKSRQGVWFVTGYDAVTTLLRDDRLSRWEAAKTELSIDALDNPQLRKAIMSNVQMLINRDEPDHSRLRKLVRAAFLPGSVAAWKPKIENITRGIIDGVIDKPEFDLVADVAFPLPEIVICDMLGVPHEDHDLWSKWSHEVVAANRTPAPTGENLRRVQEASVSFYNYFKDLVAVRRENLGDDLMSVLIKAEEDGDKLSEDELIGTAIMTIQAGQETTANLITNGMYILLKNPECYRALVEDPTLIPAAVDELLRLGSPSILNLPRMATEDIEYGDVTIRKGDHVMLSTFAANHDASVFPDPLKVDFNRQNQFRSIPFSVGIHSCLGRQLALLEARTMLGEIVARLPQLELVSEPEPTSSFTRGFQALKVRNRDVT